MSAAPPSAFRPRQRVKYVGFAGTYDGSLARVWRVTTRGVWVTLPNGARECWHPDAVRAVAEPQGITTIR